ncbi:hypothetical protein [Streptomyces ureilyticus]|uniref:Uncharacterized protein n=1 Tax=Streptomyces ureilyticus TaxID=1775131 RepID=A0ABX0DKK6_9ACTN|nr:hypothetical protein [Streptomyces ureilyticus]NGO42416.1 hypothetical protein [Streptomyces ureilyticus]
MFYEATRFATGRKNALRVEINGSLGAVAFDLPRHSLAASAVAHRSLDFLRAAARLAPIGAGVAAETSTVTATKGVGR